MFVVINDVLPLNQFDLTAFIQLSKVSNAAYTFVMCQYKLLTYLLIYLLTAARRDAIGNLQFFGARDTSDLISMVSFTFSMRRHVILLAPAPFTYFRLTKFEFRLVTSLCEAAWR